jgi:hypothetical protein
LPNGETIDYDFAFAIPNIWNWIVDASYSVLFTFSRIIPVNYLPFDRSKFVPLHDDVFISIANSFILVMLLIFIGIGLKRHFRRF